MRVSTITHADWTVFIEDTVRVLDRLGVSKPNQDDLLGLMETTRSDVS
jgi:hypothetical protein